MSLSGFMYNLAEREAFGPDTPTEKKIIDNTYLGINYIKHRKNNNPLDRRTKANTTWQFLNNLEPRLQYKLMRAFERSKPEIYDLLSRVGVDQTLLNHKNEIYGVLCTTIDIPTEHLTFCEKNIKIGNDESQSTPLNTIQELIQSLALMQIKYHKSKVRLNPQKYDTKGILQGYTFPEYDPELTYNDFLILRKLGAYQTHHGSISRLKQGPIPTSFSESLNIRKNIDD